MDTQQTPTYIRGLNCVFIHYLLLGAVILMSGYLVFKNLGDAALWSDEAETAIIARNFLKTGQFTAWDGRNLTCIRNGTVLDGNFNNRNPPLQFLLAALSFRLFGQSDFAARLPFATLAILAMLLLYVMLRSEFPDRPSFALYAAAFFGLFPEYILYFRNCRYFSAVCLFGLLTFFLYRRFIRRANLSGALGLGVSCILFFYSHPLICISFLIPLLIQHCIPSKEKFTGKHWVLLPVACVIFAAGVIPYTLMHQSWQRPDMPQGISFSDHITTLLWFVRDSLTLGIAPWSIVLASLVLVFTRLYEPRMRRLVGASLFILSSYTAFLGIASMVTVSKNPSLLGFSDIRYLTAGFPFTAILAGGILQLIHERIKFVAPLFLLLLVGTNLSYNLPFLNHWYLFPHAKIYSPLGEYWLEIHRHYATATGETAAFLLEHALQDETFQTFPEYWNNSLNWYIGQHLINCCQIDSSTNLDIARATQLSPYLMKGDNFPDWLIFFADPGAKEVVRFFSRTVTAQGDLLNRDYELFKELPFYPRETNRPEIYLHHFGTATSAEANQANSVSVMIMPQVLIYHKVKADTATWLQHMGSILFGASTLNDDDAVLNVLGRFYLIYMRDNRVVESTLSSSEIAGSLEIFQQMLKERNRFAEANDVEKAVKKLRAGL